MAAKLRVCQFEPNLHLRTRTQELERLCTHAADIRPSWGSWYKQSHVLVLQKSRRLAEQMGVTSNSIVQLIYQHVPQATGNKWHQHVKRNFQSYALRELLNKEQYKHEHYLREQFQVFKTQLPGELMGTLARRAPQRLRLIFSLTAPRVASTIFRTWLNGWCTKSRFQDRSTCMFNCSSCTSEDKIQHYAFCPVVREFATRQLMLPSHVVGNMAAFLYINRDVD